MGNWTETVVLAPIEFDGDSITVTVKRLMASDMGNILQNYDVKGNKIGDANMNRVAADLVPRYLVGVAGMTTKEGTPFTADDLKAHAGDYYFSPLIGKIYGGLLEQSSIPADQLKNFLPPAQPSSEV